jgi:hypothetical protein
MKNYKNAVPEAGGSVDTKGMHEFFIGSADSFNQKFILRYKYCL